MAGQFQTLCERKLIHSILSMHISFVEKEILDDDDLESNIETEVSIDAFRCAVMIKIVGDAKRHWILEDAKDFEAIFPFLQKSLELHLEHNARDKQNYQRFTNALNEYREHFAPKKSALAQGLSVIAA